MVFAAQTHVTIPDYAMLVGYFVLMMAIGAYFYRFMRGMNTAQRGNMTENLV